METIASAVFPIPIYSLLFSLIGFALFTLVFLAIGMLIGILSDSENSAFLGSLIVGIPLMFLSGVFFPFEMMPFGMSELARYLPINQGIEVYKQMVLYSTNPAAVASGYGYLIIMVLACLLAILLVLRIKGSEIFG